MRRSFALIQTRHTGVAWLAALMLAGCAAPRSGPVGGPPAAVEASPREMAVYPARGQSARRAEQFTVVDHCRMLGGQSDP